MTSGDSQAIIQALNQELTEARAEARHLGEYEVAYKTTLQELRAAHARADHASIRAEKAEKAAHDVTARLRELEEKCALFLKADAWVRAKISKLLPFAGE